MHRIDETGKCELDSENSRRVKPRNTGIYMNASVGHSPNIAGLLRRVVWGRWWSSFMVWEKSFTEGFDDIDGHGITSLGEDVGGGD